MSKNSSNQATGPRPVGDILRYVTPIGVAAVLAISVWTLQSVDQVRTRIDARLAQMDNRLAQVSGKVDNVAAQFKPAAAPRAPDTNRVYTINTAGAPVKGVDAAPITIAEFSDFQ